MNKSVHLIDDERPGGVMSNLKHLLRQREQQYCDDSLCAVDPARPITAKRFAAQLIVVHFSVSWKKLPYLIALRLTNPRARLILQEHHYSPEHFIGAHRALTRFNVLMRIASLVIDRFIAVSEPQAQWYRSMGVQVDAVIPPVAALDALLALPVRVGCERAVVGVSGRLGRDKGIDLALGLLELPESGRVDYLFAGFGELTPQVAAAAERFPNVTFMGAYERAEDFLSRCDVILIPSRLDSFGLTALEAKAAGKPVVVANTCGLKDQAASCGIAVERGSVKALADGLARLFETSSLADLGACARRSAAKHNPDALKRWANELQRK